MCVVPSMPGDYNVPIIVEPVFYSPIIKASLPLRTPPPNRVIGSKAYISDVSRRLEEELLPGSYRNIIKQNENETVRSLKPF